MIIYPAITISKRIPNNNALKYKVMSEKLVIDPWKDTNAIRQNTLTRRIIKNATDNA